MRRRKPAIGPRPATSRRRRRPGPSRRTGVAGSPAADRPGLVLNGAADPSSLQVVDEENDDLPETFDMRPERAGAPTLDARIFVPEVDWPAYKRRMERRGAASLIGPPCRPGLRRPAAAVCRRGHLSGALLPGGQCVLHTTSAPRPARRTHPEEACRQKGRGVVRRPLRQDPKRRLRQQWDLRPIVLGVRNGHTGHACPADHDHLEHFAGR